MHQGGVVPKVPAHVLQFVPRAHQGLSVDERLIVAQTGEGVLNRGAMSRLGAGGLAALNRGESRGAPAPAVETRGIESRLDALRHELPKTLARAVRDEVQKVTAGRR
jgi:hypothetical protein